MKSRTWNLLGACVIVLAVGFVYAPCLRGGWIWDDAAEVPDNAVLRDAAGLGKIWTGPSGPDYLPLKTSVQWLQWRIWGGETRGYHATNAALHAASAFLFWVLLRRLGVRPAWLGGLLLAIHPLAVESVAWIAELKNALSLPPLLLAMIAFVDYDRAGRRRDYVLALACFLAAMLCKSSVVMFPVVILLHAWWRRGRVGWADLRAALPFVGIAFVLGMVTLRLQLGRAIGTDAGPQVGVLATLEGAGLAASFYLLKCSVPVGLLPIYPLWTLEPPSAVQFIPWVVMACLFGVLWERRATWGRPLLFGLGFFLVNLLPVLGFIPMYYLRISRVADHLAYVPLLGCIGLAVAGVGALDDRLSEGKWDPRFRLVAAALLVFACAALAAGARRQAGLYASGDAFWSRVVSGNPDSWTARNNLGALLANEGRIGEAIDEYAEALRLNPGDAEAHFNRALALGRRDRWEEAAAGYREALRIRPAFPDAANRLGEACFRMGRLPEAIAQFREAVRLRPGYAEAYNNLGAALATEGKLGEAIAAFGEALRIRPDYADARANLARASLARGRSAP